MEQNVSVSKELVQVLSENFVGNWVDTMSITF